MTELTMYLAHNPHYEYSWRVYKSLFECAFAAKTKEECQDWATQNCVTLNATSKAFVHNPLAK